MATHAATNRSGMSFRPILRRLIAVLSIAAGSTGLAAMPFAAEAAALDQTIAACKPTDYATPTTALRHTSEANRAGKPIRILAIGSSSTQGIGATAEKFTYPAQLMADLNSIHTSSPVDVRNAGIGGETITQTLARLERELNTYKPTLVIWQLGTNDAITKGTDPRDFRIHIDAGLKSIADHRADAILLDQQYYLKIRDTDLYERFVKLVDDTALENGVGLFRRYKLMRSWNSSMPEGITPMLGPDGFHMGDKGYTCLAALLADQIATSLQRAKAASNPAQIPSSAHAAAMPETISTQSASK
jgi:lysophospholipase L1-like esterase